MGVIQAVNLTMNSLIHFWYGNTAIRKRNLLLVGLLFLGMSPVGAQDFKRQYNKAKELFQDGNYSAALDAFNPLIVYSKNNPYSEYASFYYALSAQRLGFTSLAQSQFSSIRKIYPSWNQLQEVDLWLAKLFFDKGEHFEAMALLNEIGTGTATIEADSIKRFYLTKIEDIEILKMLREDNPQDIEVDRALAFAIGKKGFAGQEIEVFDSLLEKHHWQREEFLSQEYKRSVKKDRYSVAILFPFRASTLEPSPEKKKNQPILDLYQGISLAVDSLQRAGIALDILAYDTERNPEVTKGILMHTELKSVDLIIGPLFADDAKEVQQFSKANEINLVVNPVSSNSDFLLQNPFSLLYQPSHETIGKRSAEMVAERVTNKYSLVYFGESPKDSVMAFNYMKRAFELGIKTVYAEEVRRETSNGILTRLAKATKYDEWKNPLEFTLRRDSIGSIYVASDDPVIYTKVINSVETRNDSILVIGQESWLEDTSVDFGKFENTRFVFTAPNYCPPNGLGFIHFRNAYIKKHGLMPPDYARKGYEMMMNLGRALARYGTYFQDDLLLNDPIEGVLTPGYQLQLSHDNGLVPFVRFVSGELVRIK